MTSRWNADINDVGFSNNGPSGSLTSPCRIERRYSRVTYFWMRKNSINSHWRKPKVQSYVINNNSSRCIYCYLFKYTWSCHIDLTLDWPIALAERYSNLYPFASIFENNWATPNWAQSRPTIGKICPRTSDLQKNSKIFGNNWVWFGFTIVQNSPTNNFGAVCQIYRILLHLNAF